MMVAAGVIATQGDTETLRYALVVSAYRAHGEVVDFVRELDALCSSSKACPRLRSRLEVLFYAHCEHASACTHARQRLAFCANSAALACRVVLLPNVGREASAYLHHVLNAYADPQMADLTLFLQEDEFAGMLHLAQAVAGLSPVSRKLTSLSPKTERCAGPHQMSKTNICSELPSEVALRRFQQLGSFSFVASMADTARGGAECGASLGQESCSCGHYISPYVRLVLSQAGVGCPPTTWTFAGKAAMAVHRDAIRSVGIGTYSALHALATNGTKHPMRMRACLPCAEGLTSGAWCAELELPLGDLVALAMERAWSLLFGAGDGSSCDDEPLSGWEPSRSSVFRGLWCARNASMQTVASRRSPREVTRVARTSRFESQVVSHAHGHAFTPNRWSPHLQRLDS